MVAIFFLATMLYINGTPHTQTHRTTNLFSMAYIFTMLLTTC